MNDEDEKRKICKDGEHEPVIVHRTGGLSANVKNVCGKCGSVLLNINGEWKAYNPDDE